MTETLDLNALLLALYRTARETRLEEFQDQAIRLLLPSLRFTAANWGCAPQNSPSISKRNVFLYNDAAEAPQLYEEVKEQDTAAKCAWQLGKGVISYKVRSLFRDKAHAGIRDYAQRVEHENAMLAFDIDRVHSFTKWISFYRADPDQCFGNRERRLATVLVPHLWEALAINRATQLKDIAQSRTKHNFALAIVDRAGYLHHAEAEFRALLRAEYDQGSQACLPEPCIAALLSDERFVGRSVVIEVAQRSDFLFLKARPVQLFDRLSHREMEIARAVAKGSSHKEIAKALTISPATARNHIQAIHEKMHVRNAAELTEQVSALS